MQELAETKAAISSLWGRAAPEYDQSWGHGLRSHQEKQAWSAFLAELLPPERALRVLDVGCGTGFLALLLAEAGHSVVGLDLSDRMLSVAETEATRRQLKLQFVNGDAEKPMPTIGTFDAVVSRHLL